MGRLQDGWPSPCLNGPSRDGGRQVGANFLYECGRQAGGVGHLYGREIGNALFVPSIDVTLHDSDSLPITTVVQELPSLGRSRFAAMRMSSRGRSPRMIGQ